MKKKLGAYIKFLDISTIQAWIGAVSLGFLYALENDSPISIYSGVSSLLAISLVLFYVMTMNDFFDMPVDRDKGERSVLLGGEISINEARLVVGVTAVAGLLSSFLISRWFLFFAAAIFTSTSLYSIPPVRYKRYYPFNTLGETMGGCLLFMAGYSIAAQPTWNALAVSIIPTAIVGYKRLRHEARNVEFDRSIGENSVATVYSPETARLLGRLVLIAASAELIILALLRLISPVMLVFLVAYIATPILLKKTDTESLHYLLLVWGFAFYIAVIIISQLTLASMSG